MPGLEAAVPHGADLGRREFMMEVVLNVSDELAADLKNRAILRGQSVERLVESWLAAERERDALFNRVHELREELFREHGVQPDCVPLIREDRDR